MDYSFDPDTLRPRQASWFEQTIRYEGVAVAYLRTGDAVRGPTVITVDENGGVRGQMKFEELSNHGETFRRLPPDELIGKAGDLLFSFEWNVCERLVLQTDGGVLQSVGQVFCGFNVDFQEECSDISLTLTSCQKSGTDGTFPSRWSRSVTNPEWVDRMTATASSTTRYYKYDAFGRRVESATAPYGHPVGRTYFYDLGGRLLAEYGCDSTNCIYYNATPTKTYQYFAGQLLGQYRDRIGSVRYTTGQVTSHYYPYGELVAGTSNTGPAWRDSPKPTATTPASTRP